MDSPAIYVYLRSGDFGCGVVGDSLSHALAALAPVHRLGTPPHDAEPLPGPLLERLDRLERSYRARRYVAYSVFENDIRARRVAGRARELFDVVAPASRWCEQALRDAGLTEVVTIHQAIDQSLFNPERSRQQNSRDRFVVFSGGKFELRKGQDAVAKAFRVFSERHTDAFLVAAWRQPWTRHAASMSSSPHTAFVPRAAESSDDALRRWLNHCGVDLQRVTLVPPLPHCDVSAVYGDTDVGIFPSRCEGGTNLVMMEYMACGKPVIATDFSGHTDVLSGDNSFRLKSWRPLPMVQDGELYACWCEPDVDEIVAHLEDLYDAPERGTIIGSQAAADLSHWTWEKSARRFLELLTPP